MDSAEFLELLQGAILAVKRNEAPCGACVAVSGGCANSDCHPMAALKVLMRDMSNLELTDDV